MNFEVVEVKNLSIKLENLFITFGINIYDLASLNEAYLGGGSVVQIYTNNINEINDLDIYISSNQKLQELKILAFYLICSGYQIKNYQSNNKLKEFEYLNKILVKYTLNNKSNIKNTNKYFSLKKYINGIIILHNPKLNKSIDIIIANGSTKNIFTNTVDFDIVRNYITLNKPKLYMNNQNSIDTKVATMTIQHFKKRVLNNIYEFNNFITRYMKYSNKGYKIYIDNILIKRELFNIIILNYMKVCCDTNSIEKNNITSFIVSKNDTTIFNTYNIINNTSIKHNLFRSFIKEYNLKDKFKKMYIKNVILNAIKMSQVYLELLSKKVVLKSIIEYQITNIKNSIKSIKIEKEILRIKKKNIIKSIDMLLDNVKDQKQLTMLTKEKNKLIKTKEDNFVLI